ncbi:hypothetical protein Emed_005386 [Eimeria media]
MLMDWNHQAITGSWSNNSGQQRPPAAGWAQDPSTLPTETHTFNTNYPEASSNNCFTHASSTDPRVPNSSLHREQTPEPRPFTPYADPRRRGISALGAAGQAAEAEWLADGNHPRFIRRLQDQLHQQAAEIQRLQGLVNQSRELAIERDNLHRENRDQRQRLQGADEIIEDLHRQLESYRLKVVNLEAQQSSASSQQEWMTQAERFRS